MKVLGDRTGNVDDVFKFFPRQSIEQTLTRTGYVVLFKDLGYLTGVEFLKGQSGEDSAV